MTVAEIKAKLPECEVYALTPEARYIIACPVNAFRNSDIPVIFRPLVEMGIQAAIVTYSPHVENPLSIFEIKEGGQ